TGAGLGEVGLDIGPGEDERAGLPGFADQFVVPFVEDAGGVDVGAVHPEGIGIDDQFAPAGQAFRAEFQQREAAQCGQLGALDVVQGQVADRGDDLVGQEPRGEPLQVCVAFAIKSRDPGDAGAYGVPGG